MMPSKLGSYWALSRAPRYSVTFALPLLLLYEALAASLSRFAGEQMRKGADVMLRSLFAKSLVKIDWVERKVLGYLKLSRGGMPQDIRISPDGKRFYVADMMAGFGVK